MTASSSVWPSRRGNGCNLFVCRPHRCLRLWLIGPFIVAIAVDTAEVDNNGKGHKEGLVLGLLAHLES